MDFLLKNLSPKLEISLLFFNIGALVHFWVLHSAVTRKAFSASRSATPK